MIFMRSLSIVVMSQIELIPTPSLLVYFVLKAQPFFINFGKYHCTVDLLFDWSGLVCFANKNKNCQLSYS
jgi:hypothetical protein